MPGALWRQTRAAEPPTRRLLFLTVAAAAASVMCCALPRIAAADVEAGDAEHNGTSGGGRSVAPRCGQATLNVSDVVKLASLIRDRIYCLNNATDNDGIRYHRLIPGLVRLGFHASVDRRLRGCINLADSRQATLRVTVEEMERLYQESLADAYYANVSRSDFWALGSVVAVEVATRSALSLNFTYGRCDDCVDSYETDELIDLPDQTYTGDQVTAYLTRVFGMTFYEAVAVMGAHSLGFVTDGLGNIIDKWIPNPEIITNGYFADMRNAGLGWKQVPHYYPLQNRTAWAWTHADGKRIYLNCDIGLYKALRVPNGETGVSKCEYSQCPFSRYNLWVTYFANDIAGFFRFFGAAFTKMIENGAPGLRAPA